MRGLDVSLLSAGRDALGGVVAKAVVVPANSGIHARATIHEGEKRSEGVSAVGFPELRAPARCPGLRRAGLRIP